MYSSLIPSDMGLNLSVRLVLERLVDFCLSFVVLLETVRILDCDRNALRVGTLEAIITRLFSMHIYMMSVFGSQRDQELPYA